MIEEFARAKVNLTLEVLGKRGDGYHQLRSLVVFAECGDRLTYAPGGAFSLETTGPFASAVDGENLVSKAAHALCALDERCSSGSFHLEKHIPVAAGLGGGSSDAAAALRAVFRASGRSLNQTAAEQGDVLSGAALTELAARIGADVPVCLWGRAAIMAGVGEELAFVTDFPALPAVLVNPGVKLSTRDVFTELAAPALAASQGKTEDANTVPCSDMPSLLGYLAERGNDLEAPARRLAPAIDEVFACLKAREGCVLTRLSGSGPTCFGLFTSMASAEAAAREITAERPRWWAVATCLS